MSAATRPAALLLLVIALSVWCGVAVVRWATLPATPSAQPVIDLGVRVDVNHASADELRLLPQIGPGVARNLVETREQIGGFESPDDLLQVKLIGPRRLEGIEPYIAFGEAVHEQ